MTASTGSPAPVSTATSAGATRPTTATTATRGAGPTPASARSRRDRSPPAGRPRRPGHQGRGAHRRGRARAARGRFRDRRAVRGGQQLGLGDGAAPTPAPGRRSARRSCSATAPRGTWRIRGADYPSPPSGRTGGDGGAGVPADPGRQRHTWLHVHTGGSVLIAALFHASANTAGAAVPTWTSSPGRWVGFAALLLGVAGAIVREWSTTPLSCGFRLESTDSSVCPQRPRHNAGRSRSGARCRREAERWGDGRRVGRPARAAPPGARLQGFSKGGPSLL